MIGVSSEAFWAGEALAYISMAFGLLFFAFAARYYIATVSVLLAPSVNQVNGKNGPVALANGNGNGAAGYARLNGMGILSGNPYYNNSSASPV